MINDNAFEERWPMNWLPVMKEESNYNYQNGAEFSSPLCGANQIHENDMIDDSSIKSIEEFPIKICPSIYLGNFQTLTNDKFLNEDNIQIVINCLPMTKFLKFFNEEGDKIVLPTNKMILNLDPKFDINQLDQDEIYQLDEFNKVYNKILQNYLNFFYKNNDNLNFLIHSTNYNDLTKLTINNPILTGNLLVQFFNITRFIKLCRNIDSKISILIISDDGHYQLSSALLISILMDNYNYNFDASYQYLLNLNSNLKPFNSNFYDDLIITENLKKFYFENCKIKSLNPSILTTNYKLKRRNDYDDEVSCRSNERKRKILYPRV